MKLRFRSHDNGHAWGKDIIVMKCFSYDMGRKCDYVIEQNGNIYIL